MLDAVETIFFEDGLNITVRELADRAECSRTTLYEIAPSKEDLFLLVLDRVLRRVGRRAAAAAAEADGAEAKLKAYMGGALDFFQPVGSAFSGTVYKYAPAYLLYSEHLRFAHEAVTSTVREGIKEGVFREHRSALVADVLMNAMRRLAESEVVGVTDAAMAELLDEVFELVLGGLLTR